MLTCAQQFSSLAKSHARCNFSHTIALQCNASQCTRIRCTVHCNLAQCSHVHTSLQFSNLAQCSHTSLAVEQCPHLQLRLNGIFEGRTLWNLWHSGFLEEMIRHIMMQDIMIQHIMIQHSMIQDIMIQHIMIKDIIIWKCLPAKFYFLLLKQMWKQILKQILLCP